MTDDELERNAPPGDRPPPRDDADGADSDAAEATRIIGVEDEPPLRFGADDTGPLPHWTDPPTGEVPRIFADDADEDLDAWRNLGAQQPVWRDDRTGGSGEIDFSDLADETRPVSATSFFDDEEEEPAVAEEPSRVTPIRTRRAGSAGRRGDDRGFTATRGTRGRDMPTAAAVGVGIGILFLVLVAIGAAATMALVVVVLVLAAIEFYDTLRKAGYQPAQLAGLVAVAGLPLAAYWRGEGAIPAVLFLAVVATLAWFVTSGGLESAPLPNTAVTMLGVVYIGFLGSFAALILQFPHGTETIVVVAAGTVMYDVGALFVGSAGGRTPLVPWISPNKTVEGLIGGCIAAFLTVVVFAIADVSPFSDKFAHAVQLGVVIAVAAPLGDLAESMLKRNLDVKDFGTLLPGHGGVLDRFDGFLFTLPAAYYLSRVLNVF